MQFTVESNSAAIAQALRKAAQEISDTTPLMAAIGQRLETNISERFDTKTDPAGQAWEPYKTIKAAIDKGHSGKASSEAIHKKITGKDITGSLLERTGNLRGGIEHHATADQVEVGLMAPYAIYHELGTSGRGKKGGGAIPRRGMVFGAVSGQGQGASVTQALSDSDEADVIAIIQRHIQQAADGL